MKTEVINIDFPGPGRYDLRITPEEGICCFQFSADVAVTIRRPNQQTILSDFSSIPNKWLTFGSDSSAEPLDLDLAFAPQAVGSAIFVKTYL